MRSLALYKKSCAQQNMKEPKNVCTVLSYKKKDQLPELDFFSCQNIYGPEEYEATLNQTSSVPKFRIAASSWVFDNNLATIQCH